MPYDRFNEPSRWPDLPEGQPAKRAGDDPRPDGYCHSPSTQQNRAPCRNTPLPCSDHGRHWQERLSISPSIMTDPSVAQDDSAVCEHVCDVGYQGRPAS